MSGEIKYYPLTHPQKGIWNIEKIHQNTSIGNVAGTLRIKGNVDYLLLEKAINKFIEKNDGIRIRIVEEDDGPKQYIADYKYTKIDFVDFSLSGVEEMYKWDDAQTRTPFKFIDSDLFHFVMIKLSDTDGGFYVKTHHIISDAWSMSIIGNQVVEYYSALKNNLEISENNPSYIDYIKSEQEYINSDRFQNDKEYWNGKFSDAFELTTLKNRESNEFNTVSKRKTLLTPVKFTNKLREYCAQNKVSPYTLFLCALAMYINRVSNKEDIVIGTPLLNRSNSKEKNMLGMFINPVPLRINVSGTLDFKTFSQNMLKETISILKHQKYPSDLLLKEIRRSQGISHNLYDIVLSYQNSKFNKQEHTEEYITRWHFNGHQVKPLIININDREDEGRLIVDYDFREDLFYVKEIEFIHSHIVSLLWHALDNPSKSICKLEMINEQEKHKILHQFNDTSEHFYTNRKLHDVLNVQSEQLSNKIKCYILDNNLNLLPIGIAGELYTSDANSLKLIGVSESTPVSSPFVPDEKIYRTGIIARWYPNGEIKYLGKIGEKDNCVENKKINHKEKIGVRIAATFTSEPIKDYIEWWGNKFGFNLKVSFANYNQVFQELLNPDSILATNTHGINVLLIRFEDFIRSNKDSDEEKITKLDQIFEDLKDAITEFSNIVPLIAPIFSVSTHIYLSDLVVNKINELNIRYSELLATRKNVYSIDLNEIENLYYIESVFDDIKDKEGHMPFTDEYYASIATEIARKIVAIRKQQFKVIVLDCDNTLWRGICGELGTQNVEVEGPYKYLQEFMLRKYEEGMLIAVCSKNNEQDVLEVFDNNPDMILQRKHIVSWKVNWDEKSKNIKEIANELNLGLDSFIFIDDSSIECAKMVENCPEVLTLQLPQEEQYIPLFLNHVWAFDRVKITKEDALRSSMYEAEQKRKQISESGVSIDEFLKKLQLKVSMREICEDEVARAAQLTQRTNQFNLSTIRRTESEIIDIKNNNNFKCFVIEAADKYGDYGIIGLVILKLDDKEVFIDTLLLSCRILGRKVEDAVLFGIRKFANEKRITSIKAEFIPTEKNKLIFEFLQGINWNCVESNKDKTTYRTSMDCFPGEAKYIKFLYNEKYVDELIITSNKEIATTIERSKENFEVSNCTRRNLVVDDLYNVKLIEKTAHKEHILPLKYITGNKLLELPVNEGEKKRRSKYQAPTNEVEEKIAKIWGVILKIKMIGIDDDFFEVGGDSLHAIQLQVSLLKYNWNLTTQDIYKYRTIRQMSNAIISMNENSINNVIENNIIENLTAKNANTKITSVSKKDIEYGNVLLTGATGYLGSHVLEELLISTKSNIYCLVRATTNRGAKERLENTLKFYFDDRYASDIEKRIFVINGDITLECLGLSQNEYKELQEKIDAVIHTGAVVNYYGDYSNFEEVNIKGTEKVIKFCIQDNKPLLYISTMGVSGQYLVSNKNEDPISVFTEDDIYIGQNYFENPYVRSKYEAEILVNKYIKEGARIGIIRVGNLTGRYTDGHFQKNITQNAFYNIIQSIVTIGAVSKNILEEAFDFTPVDYCSKAIVKLFKKNETFSRTFHLFNHNRNDVLQIVQLLNKLGFEIKCLDKEEFKQLIKIISSDKVNEESLRGIINDFNEEGQLKFHTSVRLDSKFTVSYLKLLGFEWPKIDLEYMKKIVTYMKQVKYIS